MSPIEFFASQCKKKTKNGIEIAWIVWLSSFNHSTTHKFCFKLDWCVFNKWNPFRILFWSEKNWKVVSISSHIIFFVDHFLSSSFLYFVRLIFGQLKPCIEQTLESFSNTKVGYKIDTRWQIKWDKISYENSHWQVRSELSSIQQRSNKKDE